VFVSLCVDGWIHGWLHVYIAGELEGGGHLSLSISGGRPG
jgi:hypothetical protein